MTPLDAVLDELAVADVHAGFPVERAALARRLLHEGVSADDVALLAAHCIATVDGSAAAARVLASILGDPGKRDARLQDLREIAARKALRARQEARAPGDAPYVPGPTEGEPREAWDHDRNCRVAWCRVNGDKAARAVVAREMDVSETTLGVMLERGRVLSRSPIVTERAPSPAAVEKAERAGEARQVEFRERMRTDATARRTKPERGGVRWEHMERRKGEILAGIRTNGVVDLPAVLRDPTAKGALATLEAEGWILRAGAPDLRQQQPYVVARDDEERKRHELQFRSWGAMELDRPRRVREEAQG